MNDWLDKQARFYSKQDGETYSRILALLPPAPEDACGSCGPHSYPAMRRFLKETTPSRMIEIGFNLGRSAMFWLTRANVAPLHLLSIDLELRQNCVEAVRRKADQGGYCFQALQIDSSKMIWCPTTEPYDAAFIDGDHSYSGIQNDIEVCRRVGVQHFLFDDWLPQYGDTQKAVADSGLRLVWVMGNMAYCRDDAREMKSFR